MKLRAKLYITEKKDSQYHEITTLGNCDGYVHVIYVTKPRDNNIDNVEHTNTTVLLTYISLTFFAYING